MGKNVLKKVRFILTNCSVGNRKHDYKRLLAFTLAEVLITLGIIGVVAAMTLPTLIQKYQEKDTVTALKKFYSSISQAYIYAKNEYGYPDIWYPENASRGVLSDIMLDNFAKFMKTTKICHTNKGCFPDVKYKKIDGNYTSNWNERTDTSKLITSDGMSVFFYSYGPVAFNDRGDSGALTETYGALSVDINGFKKPNMAGRDIFSFIIARDGIVPYGVPASTFTTNYDTMEREKAFPRTCNTENCYGGCEGCCAWVIYKENMDYLHCSDLSWDGKNKCR